MLAGNICPSLKALMAFRYHEICSPGYLTAYPGCFFKGHLRVSRVSMTNKWAIGWVSRLDELKNAMTDR